MSRLPINIINQKSIDQQLDNISISSQDSCFSSQLQDSENSAWIWISASSCALNTDNYLQFSSSSLGSQASLTQSIGAGLIEQSLALEECDWRSKILSLLHDRYRRTELSYNRLNILRKRLKNKDKSYFIFWKIFIH